MHGPHILVRFGKLVRLGPIRQISIFLSFWVNVLPSLLRSACFGELGTTILGLLTLKALITTAADDIFNTFSLFSRKIRLDILCESSARQRIHMKHKSYFLRKIKVKK